MSSRLTVGIGSATTVRVRVVVLAAVALSLTLVLGLPVSASAVAAHDVTISNAATSGVSRTAVPGSINNPNGSVTYTSTLDSANINVGDLQADLNGYNSTVSVNTGAGGSQTGTITVSVPVTAAPGSTARLIFNPSAQTVINTSQINVWTGQTYNGPTSLGVDTTLSSTVNIVVFLGTVNGAHALTIGTGDCHFGADVGGTTPLTSVTSGGAQTFSGSVSTTGGQSYAAIWLGANANTTLTSSGGGVTLGHINGGGNLTVNAAGTTTFNGTVGKGSSLGPDPLASLTVTGAGTTVISSGSGNSTSNQITTTGAQTYNQPVTLGPGLGGAVAFSTSTGNVTFGSTVDGGFPVSIGSGSGAAIFNGAVGATTKLSALTLTAPATINAGSVATTGAQDYGGNVSLQTSATLTSGANVRFGGALNGSGAALVANAAGAAAFNGQVKLDSLNTAGSASTTINTGLVSTAKNQTYGGTVNVTKPVTLAVGPTGALSIPAGTVSLGSNNLIEQGNGSIAAAITGSGSAALTVGGPGTLTLSGANSYPGLTNITGGTLKVAGAGAIPAGSNVVFANAAGAVLDLNNFSQTIGALSGGGASGGNVLLGSGTLTVSAGGQASSYGGQISGTGGLTKIGASVLDLNHANSYTGATVVSAGTLREGAPGAIPDQTALTVDGTVDLSGQSLSVPSVTGGGTVTDLSGGGTFSVSNAGADTFAGMVSGTLNLVKSGAGTLTLAGLSSYSGSTAVNAGTVALGANNALPTSTSLALAGTLDLNGFSQTLAGLTSNGVATNSAPANATLTVANTSTDQFDGSVTGNLALTKTAAGKLTLTAPSSYTGQTAITGGSLTDAVNNALPTSTLVTLANTSGAQLDLNGFNQTLAGLAGGGGSGGAALLGAGQLTIAGTGSQTFSGALSGSGTLVKSGTGTQTLAGDGSGLTGPTQMTSGTLLVDGSTANSATTLSGGTLGGTGTLGQLNDGAPGGTLAPGHSPGILNVNRLAIGPRTTTAIELNGATAGSGYDQLKVKSGVSLGGSSLTVTRGFTPDVGQVFTIVSNDGADPVAGTFAGLPEGAAINLGGVLLRISYTGGRGNDVTLTRFLPPSATALTQSSATTALGAPVAFTATVTSLPSGGATPTGTVTFKNGSTTIGSAPLVNGVASLTTSTLATGAQSIIAQYGGDTNYDTSQSAALSHQVTGQPATGQHAIQPAIGKLTQSAAVWRRGAALAHSSAKRPPVGTTFSFTLNEPAALTYTFTPQLTGRRVAGKCVARTNKNAKHARCARPGAPHILTASGHAGTNRLSFAGRLSAQTKLKPGRYKLTVDATAFGLAATSPAISFTIVA